MLEDNKRLREFARRMRKEPTAAEQALWRVVRNRRLATFKFRRQHPFGPYILDCYCRPRASSSNSMAIRTLTARRSNATRSGRATSSGAG